MSVLVNFRPRIIPKVVTRISRELSGNGQILIQVGQEVTPSDILGSSLISPGFRILNFAKEMGISPKDASKLLQKEIGHPVFRGEVLGRRSGILRKKVFMAPFDGVLDSYDPESGNLRLSYLPERQKTTAGVFGIVEKVDHPRRQVIIKTEVTEVLGILGSGKVREGNLTIIGGRGSLTTERFIVPKLTDRIIVTGGLIYERAMKAAVAIGVKGIITGGIGAMDFKSVSGGNLTQQRNFPTDVGITLMVTEGFGSFPIGEDIFNHLVKYNDKFAILDGNRARLLLPSSERDSLLNVKRTALPPDLEILVKPSYEATALDLKPGQLLRIVASSYLGEQGKLVSVDKTATLLPSGVKTYLLTIETKRRKIKAPLSNVEII